MLFGSGTNSFSQAGPIAAANNHIFVGFGPDNLQPPVIRSYSVDPATGSPGNFVETSAGAVGPNEQMRALVTDPAGRNLYAVYQTTIVSFEINSDGSLTNVGTISNLAVAFTFSLAIDPAANMAFIGVDNCPPKGTICGPTDILLLNRDANTGALSNTQKLLGVSNISSSPGALAVDPTGGHLLAWTLNASDNAQISVFSVGSDGTLTLAGSPQATPNNLSPLIFRFDSTGHLLYVLNSTDISPQPESVTVYAFNPQTGALQQLQSEALAAGNNAASLVVSSTFVFVLDSLSGTMPSIIYVLQRDANNGMVSQPVFTLTDTPGGEPTGLGDAVEISF